MLSSRFSCVRPWLFGPLPQKQRHVLPFVSVKKKAWSPQSPLSTTTATLQSPRMEASDAVKYGRSVEVDINGQAVQLNTAWLRENCTSEESYNHSTNQRNVLYYKLGSEQITVQQQESDSSSLLITWADGHKSKYPLEWIQCNAHPGTQEKLSDKQLWSGEDLHKFNLPRVNFEDFISSDDALRKMLSSLLKYGIGLVDKVPADIDGTQQTAERVCFIQDTLFGGMWSFTADLARGDTAYTNIALGAHTDTTYLSLPAGIQVFHCLHHDGTGGETLLVDGFRAAEDLRQSDPAAFELLTRHRIHHHYIEPDHHVRSLDPILKVHPVSKELEMLRYNHYDRAPICTIPQADLPEYYRALATFSELMTRQSGEYWLKLKPGTVLFVDNWRVLHGRASFTGSRRVCGCYLPRDDWVGKARILGLV